MILCDSLSHLCHLSPSLVISRTVLSFIHHLLNAAFVICMLQSSVKAKPANMKISIQGNNFTVAV